MSYFGGKAQDGVFQTIINQIPVHDRYIETFLGGGAIMLKKKLAKINIGIEKDTAAAEAFSPNPGSFTMICGCGIEFLRSLIPKKTYGRSGDCKNTYVVPPKTFIYCDPPYPKITRGKTRYRHDFTNDQHLNLLAVIRNLPFDVAISTYPNDIYSQGLHDWRMVEYNSTDRSGKVRTEHLYMNYPEPVFLHDDSYLGKNAGSRQDIKRRIDRTKKRLLGWGPKERIKLMKQLIEELPDDEKKFLLDA